MSSWFSNVRRLAGRRDQSAAFTAERSALGQATAVPTVDPRFRREMEGLAGAPSDSVHVGSAYRDPSLSVRLPGGDVAGSGHALVLGGSGAGKTRVVAGVARSLLERAATGGVPSVWLVDHKSEFVPLMQELLADLCEDLPEAIAERLLDRLVVINPFSSSLVPLQILRPEPGVGPEEQAFEVTTTINRLGGAELGVRQDAFLDHCVLLGITAGLSLPEVTRLLSDPSALARAAAMSSSPKVRDYFRATHRIAASSLEGVRARLHRLLRLPSTRLMLGARDCVSFRELLRDRIVFVDVGSPPLGCEDLARFWSGLVTLKLVRAVFERSHQDAQRPVAVFVDEWQEGLGGASEIAEHYERVLSMARSRGVSFWLISQSLAGAAKISSTLPRIVATNTNVQMLFRASMEDARGMAHLLPVTGRRHKAARLPWEDAPRQPFLSPSEELHQLTEEVTTLPDRVYYYWNRRRAYRAELVRACEVAPRRGGFRPGGLASRVATGTLGRTHAELEAEAATREAERFEPAGEADDSPLGLPGRRPRRARS